MLYYKEHVDLYHIMLAYSRISNFVVAYHITSGDRCFSFRRWDDIDGIIPNSIIMYNMQFILYHVSIELGNVPYFKLVARLA